MSNKFIDISSYNTITSYSAMGECNLKGCIIKATEGTTYQDTKCDELYNGIRGHVPIGFYHYLTSTSEPESQAQNFWEKIRDKEYQIIPVLDVEQTSLGYKAQSYSERFMEEFFKLSGHNMLIYSGRCYINDNFDVSFRNNNSWWVADYGANDGPSILGCKVIAWQYTETCEEFAFSNGNLDCNILFDEDLFYLNNYYSEPIVTIVTTQRPSSCEIEILQNELKIQGFADKNGNELIVDGVAGELTLSALPMIKTGCTGNITKWVQVQVGVTGDGAFGEETRQAVIIFQENHSLDGDGIVGQNTWRKLIGL